MAKREPVAPGSANLVRVAGGEVLGKLPTRRQKAVLDRIAARQSVDNDGEIDYSEIPALSEEQLAQFKRAPKKLVAVRLDADVFAWIREFGPGYSTRINHVLRLVMQQQR